MVKLSNIRIDRVIRRVSSGDNGGSHESAINGSRDRLGGRLEDFFLV